MRSKLLWLCAALATTSCAGMNLDALKKAPLVERGFLPTPPPGRSNEETWFTYPHPTDDRTYANVFRMGNGRVIAINLWPLSTNGVHTGDKIGVIDLTQTPEPAWVQHYHLSAGSEWSFKLNQAYYTLTGVAQGDELFVVLDDHSGTSAVVSVNALYRWRVMSARLDFSVGETRYKITATDTASAGSGILFFSERAQAAALDPASSTVALLPTYYCITRIREKTLENVLIGGSGYRLVYDGTRFVAELAK